MRELVSAISRSVGAASAVWLCGMGSAWAGGGGNDAGTFQPFLNQVCGLVGMTSCPQLPTFTQIVLEISGLQNTPPDFVRGPMGNFFGVCSVSGNSGLPVCSEKNAINAVNPPAPVSITLSDLSSLTPLRFISPQTGQGLAAPVPPGNGENSFFYAVATEASGQPDTLVLTYDYPPQTNANFAKGQFIADLSLPLVVLNSNGTQRSLPIVLQVRGSGSCANGPPCYTTTAVGNFLGNGTQARDPADLGVNVSVVFALSPAPAPRHLIFEVQAPLLVTGPANSTKCGAAISIGTPDPADCGNDPAYFGVAPSGAVNASTGSPTHVNQMSGLPTAFFQNAPGFPVSFLKGAAVGIAPYAAPLCTLATCPPPATPPAPPNFGYCANFSAAGAAGSHSAVDAFAMIGTEGTTYVSSPVAASGVVCPF
jgi:hypothetical protein